MDIKVVACNGLAMNLKQQQKKNNSEAGAKNNSADFALILQKIMEKRKSI